MRPVAGCHIPVHRPRELADQPEADAEVAVGIRRAEHVVLEAALAICDGNASAPVLDRDLHVRAGLAQDHGDRGAAAEPDRVVDEV